MVFPANGAIGIGCEHPRAHKNAIVDFLVFRVTGLEYIITRVSNDTDINAELGHRREGWMYLESGSDG